MLQFIFKVHEYLVLCFRTQEHVIVDGIDVEKLSDAEVYDLLNAEDVKFTGELGQCTFK